MQECHDIVLFNAECLRKGKYSYNEINSIEHKQRRSEVVTPSTATSNYFWMLRTLETVFRN